MLICLLAAGIFSFYSYRHGAQADQALERNRAQLAAVQEEAAQLKQKMSAAEEAVAQLKASAQELEAKLQAAREAEGYTADRFQGLQQEVEQLQATLAEKDKALAALQTQYAEKEAAFAETLSQKSRLVSDIQNARKALAAREGEAGGTINRLQTRIRELQSQLSTERQAIGHSYFQPVASNDTREGRARNRRVEISVVPF